MSKFLTPDRIHFLRLRHEAADRDCAFVEAEPGAGVRGWTCLTTRGGSIHNPNHQLVDIFENRFNRPVDQLWKNLRGTFDWRGFLLPPGEVKRLGKDRLTTVLQRLEAYFHSFSYINYLEEVQQVSWYPAFRDTPLGAIALFHFLPYYLDLLHRTDNPELAIGRIAPDGPLDQQLLVVQATELLLMLVRTHLPDRESRADLQRAVAAVDGQVRTFFQDHFRDLDDSIQAALGGDAGAKFRKRNKDAEFDFYHLVTQDLRHLRVEVMTTDPDNELFERSLSPDLRKLLRARRSGGPPTNSGKAAPTVFDRIAAFGEGHAAKPPDGRSPSTSAPDDPSVFGPAPLPAPVAYRRFTEREINQLLEGEENSEPLRRAAAELYDDHLANLLNRLTNPVVEWHPVGGETKPSFRIDSSTANTDRWKQFNDMRLRAREERAALVEALPQLAQTPTLKGINRLAERARFTTPLISHRWESALRDRRQLVDQRERFRLRKMREYGLDDFSKFQLTRDLYLDELLRIEEEVAPFVPYVRRAFRAALPVGSHVQVNPYRHSIDGFEFDPETLRDPNKYLRGEVMSMLQVDRSEVPILQVNAFCLDYSKSMTHEPMRNLFKLVTLLVMGLEDRQTYDAIHFFGSDFMEVADFNDRYTSRRMLFRVLRAISNVNGVNLYYGGSGYTNISAGVQESQRRVTAFADRLADRYPNAHMVRSLFVLSDGEPTGGIMNPDKLRDFIEQQRRIGDLAIKGIYLQTGRYVGNQISYIFGPGNYVETDSFEDAVVTFVDTMTTTYQAQRKAYRAALRRKEQPSRKP